MSMNATLMSHYIQFCANCLLCKLKQPTSYLQCYKPLPMDGYYEYAKVESILQAMPSTTYSLLMNSSKACNKFHLSLHLSMLPKLALEVTDLVHGSHFFGDSNRQTLSICYAGSLEKIKLLGAIY
jgi:hypothetical protein